MLDWQSNEKYANFGHNKQRNREVNLTEIKPPPISQPSISIKKSRNARKSSILGALVEESQRFFETEFD